MRASHCTRLSAATHAEDCGDRAGHVTDVWEHLNIGRMYGYDGTFYKSTTQGWMAQQCPSGPMEAVLPQVDLAYAQCKCRSLLSACVRREVRHERCCGSDLGQGIPSCFSCDRAYDGEDSKQLIAFWISFFKTHRALLTTDLIHLLLTLDRSLL